MTQESRALSELFAAAPTFRFASGDADSVSTTGPSEAVGELVEHLGGDEVLHQELANCLQVAESLLTSGDPTSKRLAVDFLEDLQLLASYPDVALDVTDAEAALPDACRTTWESIDRTWRQVWAGLGPGSETSLTLAKYEAIVSPAVRRLVHTTYRVMPDGRFVGVPEVVRWEAGIRRRGSSH
jgi:hypothetical protein